jgi:hypothetical protein
MPSDVYFDKGGAVYNARASGYGATGDGTTDDSSAIQTVLDLFGTQQYGILLLPPPPVAYLLNSSHAVPTHCVVYAEGAVIKNGRFTNLSSSTDVEFIGGTYLSDSTKPTSLDSPINLSGNSQLVLGVRVRGKEWVSPVELKPGSQKVRIVGYEFDAQLPVNSTQGSSETLVIQGSHHVAAGVVGDGIDDGIVFKASVSGSPTESNAVGIASISKHSNVFSVGTEVVGTVRNVVATCGAGHQTAYGVLLKIGNSSGYENSALEGFRASDIVVYDANGDRFNSLVKVAAWYSSQIRDVSISGGIARVRANPNAESQLVRLTADGTGAVGGVLPVIDGVSISQMRLRDLGGGAPAGGATPGSPVSFGVVCEEIAGGTVKNARFSDLVIDGCGYDGMLHSCPSNNEAVYDGLVIRNYGATSTDPRYGVHVAAGTVRARNWTIEPHSNASYLPIMVESGATLIGEEVTVPLGSFVSGQATTIYPLLRAPKGRRMWVMEVLVVATNAITNSSTNYLTFNVGKSLFTNFLTGSTQPGGMNLATAYQAATIGAPYPTNANSFFSGEQLLQLQVTPSGSSAPALNQFRAIVRYVLY